MEPSTDENRAEMLGGSDEESKQVEYTGPELTPEVVK